MLADDDAAEVQHERDARLDLNSMHTGSTPARKRDFLVCCIQRLYKIIHKRQQAHYDARRRRSEEEEAQRSIRVIR